MYDFRRDLLFPNSPGVRMGFKTEWSFQEEWKVSQRDKKRLTELIEKIVDFWGEGRLAQGKSLEEEVVFGQPLAQAYKEWIRGCEGAVYQRTMLEVYAGNADELLWKLLAVVSAAIAFSRRCEYVYEWGAGNSGKDLQHNVVVAFLGDSSKGGYTQAIPSNLLTSTARSDPNGTQTFKHKCMNKRYVYFNELKFDARGKDRYFDDGDLKGLCEQEGTPIQTRTLYAEPESWKPMAVIQGTGNPPLPLTDEQCADTGTRRRLNYSRMPREFTLAEDKDLKKTMSAGVCNAELFFLCKLLWRYVESCGKRLEPIPPRVRKETLELLNQHNLSQLKALIENAFKPCLQDSGDEPDTQADVRKYIGRALPNIGEACEKELRKIGVVGERSKHVRFYTYAFPESRRPFPIKLREEPVEA